MDALGELLMGVGNFIIACIAIYNLIVARGRAQKIATLEANTNSIKDALIKVTGESEHAKGVIVGHAEAAEVGKAVVATLKDMQAIKE